MKCKSNEKQASMKYGHSRKADVLTRAPIDVMEM